MTQYLDTKIAALEQALNTLKDALLKDPSDLERDGAIQRFEYCFDLSWKTLRQYLESIGLIDLNSPRSVFAAGHAEGVIDDEVIWSIIIQKRNVSTHTYNWKLAESLFKELPAYYEVMASLLLRLKQ